MKYRNILILGAAGQIARKLTTKLLLDSDLDIILYCRNVGQRLGLHHSRVTLVDGLFSEAAKLSELVSIVDLVYINTMENPEDIRVIAEVLEKYPKVKLIGASMAGLHEEVPSELAKWTQDNLPSSYIEGEKQSATIIEQSSINYTLLHLTWLYDQEDDFTYELVLTPESFKDAEVSREAVVQAIYDIITDENQEKYSRKGFGVGRPNTHYAKPSFY